MSENKAVNVMTVCHITQSFYNPLYSIQFDKMRDNGLDVIAFNFLNKENQIELIQRDYLYSVKPYSNLDRFFFLIKEKKVLSELDAFLAQKQVDLLHAHTLFSSGYLAYCVSEKYGTDFVVSVRNTDINHFFKKRIFLRRLGIRILKKAKKIIFISENAKDELLEKYVDAKDVFDIESKSVVCTNGIADFWLKNKTLRQRDDNSNIKILYFGDINKNKNLLHTVKACDILQSRGFNVKYTVIGKISDPKLWKQISRKYIEYHDFMDKEELIDYIRCNDIFVMPSFSETFGLSYLEAMSQGLPVIYTRGQGFDGLFEEGCVGYSVDPTNETEISDKIQRIIEEYEKMSLNSYQQVDLFDWDNIVEKLVKVYLSVAEEKNESY